MKPLKETIKNMFDNDSNANTDADEEYDQIKTRVYNHQEKMDHTGFQFVQTSNMNKKRKVADPSLDNTPPALGLP